MAHFGPFCGQSQVRINIIIGSIPILSYSKLLLQATNIDGVKNNRIMLIPSQNRR